MKNSYKMIYQWMISIIDRYEDIRFKYFFNKCTKAHYIAVYQLDKIDDDESYCSLENNFFYELSNLFPKERFIFGTEDQNFKISEYFTDFVKDNIPPSDLMIEEYLRFFYIDTLKYRERLIIENRSIIFSIVVNADPTKQYGNFNPIIKKTEKFAYN